MSTAGGYRRGLPLPYIYVTTGPRQNSTCHVAFPVDDAPWSVILSFVMTTTTAKPRTTCPACSKGVALSAKGTIAKHGHSVSNGLVQPGVSCCFMSFERPADYATARLINAQKGLVAAKATLTAAVRDYDRNRAAATVTAWEKELTAAQG
jgi:hypothetical protein